MKTRHSLIRIIFCTSFLFASCSGGFGIDAHEEHLKKDCNCEEFASLENSFPKKGGHVQGCGRKSGDSLKWGFIIDNDACEPFLPFLWDDVKSFDCGLAPVKKGQMWGVIDTTGKPVIDYKYFNLESFTDSLSAFQDSSKKWGFISTKGEVVVKPFYKYVSPFFAQIAMVQRFDGGWNVINSAGDALPIKIDGLISGYYINEVDKNDLILSWGYMDKDQEFFDYPIYTNGKKMKLIAFNKQYALVSDTVDTRAIEMGEKQMDSEKLQPIFTSR